MPLRQVVVAALLRPGEVSKLRRLWNLGHWWLGRAALAVALGHLFFGLRLGGEGLLYFLVLAAIVAAWLLAGATKDLVDSLRLPPPGEEELGKKRFQDRMVEVRAGPLDLKSTPVMVQACVWAGPPPPPQFSQTLWLFISGVTAVFMSPELRRF